LKRNDSVWVTEMTANRFNLGGKTRLFPRDFIVQEAWNERIHTINYSLLEKLKDQIRTKIQKEKEYLHFTLVKTNWDTIRALNYIGKKLHVSLKRFGISGMKDKRAITSQRVSMWNGRIENVSNLKLKDMFLKDFKYSDERINLGNAIGNQFTITIRHIPRKKDEIENILNHFKAVVISEGIPNYYGHQRMGGKNVEVGAAIKAGHMKAAVELILQKVMPYLEEGGVESIPKVFWYEKNMVKHLSKYPNDYVGALRKIPKKILTLYVHSYQSHLFNNELEHAILEQRVTETITVPGFSIPKIPELKTFPIIRRTYLIANTFENTKIIDGFAIISFFLNKGEYASTLLAHLI